MTKNTVRHNSVEVVVTHPGKKPISDEQALELVKFAEVEGRRWKSALSGLWMRAAANPLLHQLRNSHGPTWLQGVRINASGEGSFGVPADRGLPPD